MFGYVNVYKDELKISEYNMFRAYYCGLCKKIGTHSQAARLGLSYDMTFLSILLSSLSNELPKVTQCRCIAHPLKKRGNVISDNAISYCAEMSILLTYLKLADDWQDDHSISAYMAMFAYRRPIKKLKAQYPKIYDGIVRQLELLNKLEKENTDSIDEVADCFAKILSILFVPDFITDDTHRRCLAWLGYNTGRWIYVMDAFCDIEKDFKKHNYNPFLANFHGNDVSDLYKKLESELKETLTFTLQNVASSYELLTIHKNDGILKNILYLGLKNKQDYLLGRKAGTIDESVSNTRG